MRGFQDLVVGTVFETAARTVTETDVVQFAGVSGDFNPIHTDAAFAATSIFGSRIAHGLLGLSIASGLLTHTAGLGPNVLAFLGINEWAFRAPIRIGDTIRARATVKHMRASRQPNRAIVTQTIEIVNQQNIVVQTGEFVVLVGGNVAP